MKRFHPGTLVYAVGGLLLLALGDARGADPQIGYAAPSAAPDCSQSPTDIPAPADPAMFGGFPRNQTPMSAIPMGPMPMGPVPMGTVPMNSVAMNPTPFGPMPVNSMPVNSMPIGSMPMVSMQMGSAPMVQMPMGQMPMVPDPTVPAWNGPVRAGSDSSPLDILANAAPSGQFFGGADFLFVRPHFSEATAFARGTLGLSGLNVTSQQLEFGYESSFRVFAGYRFEGTDTELKFTYTRLPGDSQESVSNPGPGRFVVDPFGNIVGTAMVVDPNSAQFGQTIVGGDHIHTEANVTTNVYDLELVKAWCSQGSAWILKYSLGVKVAEIHQSYDSVVDSNGVFYAGGSYTGDFLGAGPRVGLQGSCYLRNDHRLSLFANSYTSLILGEYNAQFSQTTTSPAFHAAQSNDVLRTVPVFELEAGAACQPCDWLNISVGWLFQAWFDLGTSGGKFDGFYTVTQNANIMSFDGLFVRAEVTF